MNFNDMIDSGYFGFMAEAEGHDELISTRTAKINAAINEFVDYKYRGYDINDMLDTVLNRHGLTYDNLSDTECARIQEEVNRR